MRLVRSPIAVAMTATAILCAAVLLTWASIGAAAQEPVPTLTARVNDLAGLLDDRQERQLNDALEAFEQDTTTQIALLTTPSLGDDSIEQYSMRVAEAWKLGRKGRDNGVLLVVAPNERKVRIEVGYGLEGTLTDAVSARIIRDIIVPAFKTGNYYTGIAGGLDAIMAATKGEFTAPPANAYSKAQRHGSIFGQIITILIFLMLISTRFGRMMLFTMMLTGGRGGRIGRSGGGFSGGGGGFGGGGASGSW